MPRSREELVGFVENLKLEWLSLVDSIIDPIMIVNSHYKIEKANKAMAKMSGTSDVKSILGSKCHKIFAGSDAPCSGCRIQEAIEKESPCTFELSEQIPGKHYEVSSQPLFNADGEIGGVVQVYRDRTEAKNLHKQLIQSEKLASIGLLAGGIAHEINNPLGGILIFSQMLLRELDESDQHYQDIVEIESATQRCKEIVDRLLDFARQQPGDIAANKTKVPVQELIQSAMKFAKVGKNGKKCEVYYNWEDEAVETSGDRNKYIQVFLNLFQNSFHAMPNGGTLTVSQTTTGPGDDDKIKITVKDTGHGIAPENLEHIFEPFFTTKEPGEGTGLGLSICYGILTELGGEMMVSSEVNEGTTFTIELPKYKKEITRPKIVEQQGKQ